MITRLLWKNYRFSSSLKHRFKRRFTAPGILVLGAALVSGAMGIDTSQAMAYQVFNLLAVILVISLLWNLAPTPRFQAQRILPRVGTAGQPLIYNLAVKNLHRKPQHSVSVIEDLGDPRPSYKEFANNPEPGERQRNLFDRFFRFYRWMWLISRNEIAQAQAVPLPALAPRKTEEVRMEITPTRRGQLHFTGLDFSIPDLFGLTRRFSKARAPQSVIVLPRRYHLPFLDLPGNMQYQPGGVNLAASLGESEEFVALREYRRGDPLRHIHWKSVSKTGKLIVKEFQNEFFVRHALILDTFLDHPELSAFEEAVSIAASFACALNTQETLLDLIFVGPKAVSLTSGHGVCQVEHVLEILAVVQPCTNLPFAELERVVLQQISFVSGCVCLFLRWDKPRQELVRKLIALDIPVMVLVIKEEGDTDPEAGVMSQFPGRFHVLESGKIQEGINRI